MRKKEKGKRDVVVASLDLTYSDKNQLSQQLLHY